MASNTRVPKAEITGIYGYLLKKMSRKMLGHVPESVGVMWHNPAVLKDMMGFGRKVERWDRLDRNLATFAGMAAAGVVGLQLLPGSRLLHGTQQGSRRGQSTGGAALARVRRFHSLGAESDGVRRGDEPDPADRHRRDVGRAAREAGRSSRCCSTARSPPGSTWPASSTRRPRLWSRTAGSPASTGSATRTSWGGWKRWRSCGGDGQRVAADVLGTRMPAEALCYTRAHLINPG